MKTSGHDLIEESLARVAELRQLYPEFSQPRTDVQLRAFVVGQHDTPMRKMHQCLLEIAIKDRALRRAQIYRRQALRKIGGMNREDGSTDDDRELLEIDLEETDEAMLGAGRELRCLLAIFDSLVAEYGDFGHAAWMAEELEYWTKRLTRQSRQEINACGTIGVGNQDALEQIGISTGPLLAEGLACLDRHRKNLEHSDG